MRYYDQNVPKRMWGAPAVVAAAGTTTPDISKGRKFSITLTGATATIANPLNYKPGDLFSLYIRNYVGACTITWGSAWKHEGGSFANTATAGKMDVLSCHVAKDAQTLTITLSGSSGTATIVCGGVSATATWNTSLTQTAADFAAANAAAYLVAGMYLTAASGVLSIIAVDPEARFATRRPNGTFIGCSCTNLSLTLGGTVAETTLPGLVITTAHKNYTIN